MVEIQRYSNKTSMKLRTGGIFQGFFSNLLTFFNNLLQFNLIDLIYMKGAVIAR